MRAQTEWQPVLVAGREHLAQSSVTVTGEVNATPGRAVSSAAAESAFGGFMDAMGGEPAAEGGCFTAEWIEFEVATPGRGSRRIRRDVFDLIGPAARVRGLASTPTLTDQQALARAAALAGETIVLPLVSALPREFVEHLLYSGVIAQRDRLRAMASVRDDERGGRLVELASAVEVQPAALYGLALARSALSPVQNEVYVDDVNVFAYHTRLRPVTGGGFARSRSIDIVWNQVGARVGTDAIRSRLLQGVADTVAEAMAAGGCGACPTTENVSELQALSESTGTSWITIQSTDDAALSGLGLHSNAMQRIVDDLRSGYSVRVPAHAVTVQGKPVVGWWRVDRRSGTTLGVMESGEGQAVVEYKKLTAFFFTGMALALAYQDCEGELSMANKRVGKTVACLACTAAAGIGIAILIMTWGTAAPAEIVTTRAVIGAIGGLAVCALSGILD